MPEVFKNSIYQLLEQEASVIRFVYSLLPLFSQSYSQGTFLFDGET